MSNQPGIAKSNPLTQMLDRVKEINAQSGAPAGRSVGTPMIHGGGPRVRTAQMDAPPILTPEETLDLDEKARAIGILPPDEDDNPYPPVGPPEETRQTAREFLGLSASDIVEYQRDRAGYSPLPSTPIAPRLIDFKKIQGIDFHRNIAYVDGFEIEIPEEKIKEFKRYIIDLAVKFVTTQLNDAIAELNESEGLPLEAKDDGRTEVQESSGEVTERSITDFTRS